MSGRLRGFGWSAAYLVVTRVSTLIAVPLVLHELGAGLYAAWVLAGTIVMAQGLVDFGTAAATIRFVAIGGAEGSRSAVTGTLLKSALFYGALSAVVAGLLLAFGGELIELTPAVPDTPAVTSLIAYTAAAFALTNGVMLLASTLQGLDRVDAAFRGQTLGWLVYVPVLAGGLALDWGIDAVGAAWVAGYAVQLLLLAVDTVRGVRAVPQGPGRGPSVRALFGLGARWQVSSWADFATFQLPRLLGAVVLSSSGLVMLDIVLRGAQLVVAPFFAAFPLVLPAAAAAWTRERERGIAAGLERWTALFAVALILALALAIPLLPPALTVWSGIELTSADWLLSALVVTGTVAHASTGPLTSALLAAGLIEPIIGYKLRQLVLAAILLPTLGQLGLVAIGVSLAIALAAPAALFVRRAARELGLGPPDIRWGHVAAAAAACVLLPAAAVMATADAAPGVRLAAGLAAAALALACAAVLTDARRLLPASRLAA